MKILITGCAGFIGSSFAEEILKNNSNKIEYIVGIDNFDDFYSKTTKQNNMNNFINNNLFKFYKTDINDIQSMEKIFNKYKFDVVVHFAAKPGVRNSFKNPEDYFLSNEIGTLNVLKLMKKYNVNRIIFASSSSVYGDCGEKTFSDSTKKLVPISPYSLSKKLAEELIDFYSRMFGINAICLRFFSVYGPKQRPDLVIHKFIKAILNDEPVTVYGDGKSYRDYTYISDIVDGIISAVFSDLKGYQIINLGSGKTIDLHKMVKYIEKELNKKAKIIYNPSVKGDIFGTKADLTKAKKLLNYEPKVTFEEGIHKYIQSEFKTR